MLHTYMYHKYIIILSEIRIERGNDLACDNQNATRWMSMRNA